MIPIVILEKGTELPKTSVYYVICQQGMFMVTNDTLIQTSQKVDKIPFLEKMDTYSNLNLPKIPGQLIVKAFMFFKEIYKKFKTESASMLLFNTKTSEYALYIPKQKVSGAAVDYTIDNDEIKKDYPGFRLVGTIHSHSDFGAFHSGTDIADEKHFDGIHITLGHVNEDYFTFTASTVIGKERDKLKPKAIVDGISKVKHKKKTKVVKPTVVNEPVAVATVQEDLNLTFDQPEKMSFGENKKNFGLAKAIGDAVDKAGEKVGDVIVEALLGPPKTTPGFGGTPITTPETPNNFYGYPVNSSYQSRFTKREDSFEILLAEDDSYKNYLPPQSWLDKVTKQSWAAPLITPFAKTVAKTTASKFDPRPGVTANKSSETVPPRLYFRSIS